MKSLKRINFKTIILLSAMVFISSSIFAQQRPQQGQQQGQQAPQLPTSSEIAEIVEELTAQLSLNEYQEADIHKLFLAHFEEVEETMESNSGQRPSREKMEGLKTKFEENVKKLLTSEQQELFGEYMKKNNKQPNEQKQRR